MSTPNRITDPIVRKIYSLFYNHMAAVKDYHNNRDDTVVQFDFTELDDHYLLKVKFRISRKIVRFEVPIGKGDITWSAEVKTLNIVEDIDRIHKQVFGGILTDQNDLPGKVAELYLWGIARDNRDGEISLARAVKFSEKSQQGFDPNSCLLYGVISKTSVERIDAKEKVKVSLVDGTVVEMDANTKLHRSMRPGQILIQNAQKRATVMGYGHARHHLAFDAKDRIELETQQRNKPATPRAFTQ